MKRKTYIICALTVLASALIGCSVKDYTGLPEWADKTGTPRLVVGGTVTNTANEPLKGIYVAIYGVREENEPDALRYNYALTDSAGYYTIVRYRGRELPTEVTVVATDSTGIYEEKLLIASVTYDSINTTSGKQPFNAFVTADFILKPHE